MDNKFLRRVLIKQREGKAFVFSQNSCKNNAKFSKIIKAQKATSFKLNKKIILKNQSIEGSSDLNKLKNRFKRFRKTISYKNKLKEIENDPSLKEVVENNEKLNENELDVSKKSSKKKKYINLAFFIINVLIVAGILVYQLYGEPFVSLMGLGVRPGYIVMLVVTYGVLVLLDVLAISYLIRKDIKRWQLGLGFKTTTIGRYYDAITPMAIGGQPFQVAYLKKHDVSSSASLSIPVAKMIFQQFAAFILSLIALIVSFADPTIGMGVSIMSVVGFVLTFSVLFFTVFLSTSKKTGKVLVVKTLKLLEKMKIIKNYEKQYSRVTNYVEEFQSIMQTYVKNPKDCISMFIISFLRLLFNYSMPFIIYCCFMDPGGIELFFKFFMCGILIDLASGFFPLPGGTGMNELTFSALFSSFFQGGALFWALIFWRMMTYYSYIIIGIVVLGYDMSYGNRKFKWNKKEQELKQESLIFKQEQIARFRNERDKRRKKQVV